MSNERERNEDQTPQEIENLDITPVSDEDLDSVAGGREAGCTNCCGTGSCTSSLDTFSSDSTTVDIHPNPNPIGTLPK